METGDADVRESDDVGAEERGGDGGFFGDGEIAGTCTDNGYGSLLWRRVLCQSKAAGKFVMLGGGDVGENGGGVFGRDTRCEDADAGGCETQEDFGHLRGRLAGGEDDFRHTGAQGAMVVEAGEAEVLKRKGGQPLSDGFGGGFTSFELTQELENGFTPHEGLGAGWCETC